MNIGRNFFERMTESVIFSGIVEALACILLFSVELCGAIANPTEYNAILIPGDVIEGWHQAGENYHRFERRLIIKHDHPYDQYSNTKIFWPEEKSPYTTNTRITSFKCINRTPNNARALMHVIRGGTGRPDLVVHVIYTPLRFMIINTMIITCDIYYTEDSKIVKNEERVSWNAFDTMESTTEREIESSTAYTMPRIGPTTNSPRGLHLETTSPVDSASITEIIITSQTTLEGTSTRPGKRVTESIRKVNPTTQRTTKTIINDERLPEIGTTTPSIESTEFHNEDTSGGTDKATTFAGNTNEETETKLTTVQGTRQKLNGIILSTTPLGLYLSSEESQHEGTNRIILDTEKTSPVTVGTTLAVTSPKLIETSSRRGHASTVPWYDSMLQKKNNESLYENERKSNTSSADDENDEMKTTSAAKISALRTEKTTLEVKSAKTPEETLATTPMVDITRAYFKDDSSSENKNEVELRCRLKNLRIIKTKLNANVRIKDLQEQEGAGSTEGKTVNKPKSSSAYNLRVKIMPTDSKRKIGLAKITY